MDEPRIVSLSHPRPLVATGRDSSAALKCDEGSVRCVYLEPGEVAVPHRHETLDVMVIWQGIGIAIVDGREYRVGPGDVILNPPGTLHGLENNGFTRLIWAVIQSPPTGAAPERDVAAAGSPWMNG